MELAKQRREVHKVNKVYDVASKKDEIREKAEKAEGARLMTYGARKHQYYASPAARYDNGEVEDHFNNRVWPEDCKLCRFDERNQESHGLDRHKPRVGTERLHSAQTRELYALVGLPYGTLLSADGRALAKHLDALAELYEGDFEAVKSLIEQEIESGQLTPYRPDPVEEPSKRSAEDTERLKREAAEALAAWQSEQARREPSNFEKRNEENWKRYDERHPEEEEEPFGSGAEDVPLFD